MDKIWQDLSSNLKQNAFLHLVQTKNAGRGLIATNDFERDDIILEEFPLITGPSQSLSLNFCANCSQTGILDGKYSIM